MNHFGHPHLVRLAVTALPESSVFRRFTGDIESTCLYPDTFAVAYGEGRTGPWRQYFPPAYRQEVDGSLHSPRKLRKMFPPTGYYIRKIKSQLKINPVEAAKYAGVFSHYLGDFAQPAHWYGIDIYSLMPPPGNFRNCNLHQVVEAVQSDSKGTRRKPELLGMLEPDIILRMEARYQAIAKTAVAALVPMLQALYKGDEKGTVKAFNPAMNEAAAAFADFIYSLERLADNSFTLKEIERNKVFSLLDIFPWDWDVEGLYGKRPLLDFVSANGGNNIYPFRINRKTGKNIKTVNVRGIVPVPYALPATGRELWSRIEYRLPTGRFSKFTAEAAPCAKIPNQAKCRFVVGTEKGEVFSSRMLGSEDPAVKIDVNISGCRKLLLSVYTDGSTDKLVYPVWAEPELS